MGEAPRVRYRRVISIFAAAICIAASLLFVAFSVDQTGCESGYHRICGLAALTNGLSIFGANLLFVAFAAVGLCGAAILLYRGVGGIALAPMPDGVLATRYFSKIPVPWSDIEQTAIRTDQVVPYLEIKLREGKKLKFSNLVEADARAFEVYARERLAA